MLLYPNPAKDVLNVKINSLNSNASLFVTDVSGKAMLSKSSSLNKGETIITVDVSGFAAGTYFIKFVNADGTEKTVSTFVKQ